MPGRLRHRAPLLALGADVEAAIPPAGQRRVAAARPAPGRRAGNVRDARVDDDAHSVPDGELIAKDHAGRFAEGERPCGAAGPELERPRALEHGRGLGRPVAADVSVPRPNRVRVQALAPGAPPAPRAPPP